MLRYIFITITALLSVFLLFSCGKVSNPVDPNDDNDRPPLDLTIPQGFDYSTTRDLSLDITAVDIDASRTIVQVYNDDPLAGGRLIDQVVVRAGETVRVDMNLPTYKTEVWLRSTLPSGLFSLHIAEITQSVNAVQVVTILDETEPASALSNAQGSKLSLKPGSRSFVTNPVTNDFEAGNRNVYAAQCWIFQATSVEGNGVISGNFSMRTGPMTSPINPQVLTSPWVDLDGSGTLDFKHYLDNFRGTKELTVLLLDNSGNANPPVILYYHDYETTTALQDVSIPITATGIHRIAWVFRGTGGNARGFMDDVSIPGMYASNPDNGCEPLVPTTPPSEIINNYPADGVFGTLAFEDLWPNFGDYDMNDLVLDYNVRIIANGDNNITSLEYTKVIRAIGAGLDSGFGIEFPVAPSRVSSVTGQRLNNGLINTLGNGTEAGQSRAVVMFWDDSAEIMGKFANTQPEQAHVPEDTIRVTITFNPPVSRAELGNAPWNPFIFVRGNRGQEIHLPNRPGTLLADPSFFGSFNDDSNPASGKFYLSETNLNWAINLPESFVYPRETVSILEAYPRYRAWAESGGEANPDWYRDLPGNRVNANLYFPPSVER